MKKVAVIGHFGFGHEYLDGQTVKTKILTEEFCRCFGEDEVIKIDTHGGIKTLLQAPFQVSWALKNSENVIVLPAQNGVRVFGRLLPLFKNFFKKRKIHYSVIGGWLPKMLENKRGLARVLKKFDGIYVETSTMKKALEQQGFRNICVIPNCKKLMALREDELVYPVSEPYKLCTFSRVMREKGIEDAVNAVKAVNDKFQRTVFELDIYGPVDTAQTEWFDSLCKSFPQFVQYRGVVPFDKSVEVLKDYFALLFPTRFYTEGVPGTIIDAYAAGVPVISARWQSFADIVEENVTGLGYEFCDEEDFLNNLLCVAEDVNRFNLMKPACLEYSNRFLPQEALKTLYEFFG